MQLRAASLGEAVPRESFNAEVQSVFESAVNLRLEAEDRLVTLLISDRYELPQGIRITRKVAPLSPLTVGRRAAARGGVLRFDSFPLSVDLRDAAVWKCRLPELQADLASPEVQQAWSAAWNMLNREQRLKGAEVIADDLFHLDTGPRLTQRISRPLLQLIHAPGSFDVEGALEAARKMIGLGPGVTPAGDDVLIGFLAGLWCTTDGSPQQPVFLQAFGDALLSLAKGTGEISRTYLFHASRGQFSSSLTNLAEALSAGKEVQEAAKEAMRVGHSSGMDSVTGLLTGMCAWGRHNLRSHLAHGENNNQG